MDAYNEAVAAYSALLEQYSVSASSTASITKIDVDNAITDSGKYMDALAENTNFVTIATDALTATTGLNAQKAGIDAAATFSSSKTTATDLATEYGTKITGTGALSTDVKNAITAIGSIANISVAEADQKIHALLKAASGVVEAAIGLTADGADSTVPNQMSTTGVVAGGSAYEDYITAKGDYETKKAAYDKVGHPWLLTGQTVGLAASDDLVTTASGQNAITITANTEGIKGQISGLNISITDSEGNVKKSANAALDAFSETVRAQNESKDNAISLQVGAKANQSIKVGLTDMRAEALGLQGADGTKLNISTQEKANAAINVLDNAIQKALDQQTTIGSVESRLEYTSSNLTTASENVQASESTIRDADMAKEMTEYTKNNVLLQAAQSMLAQANQSSSNVLSLLQ